MPSSRMSESSLVSPEFLAQKRLEVERRASKRQPKSSSQLDSDAAKIPISYIEFVTQVLAVELTPAQRVFALVCFDGAEPVDLEGADRELASELFGEAETFPKIARDVLAMLVGGRSGKSYLCALRVLHLALTHPLTTLAPGERGFGLIVAPDQSLAEQSLRYCSGAANANPTIRAMIVSDTVGWLTLKRPDGQVVTIWRKAATRGGKAGRGRSLFAALLDEACFFLDSNYVVNDDEIYKAVAPRVLPGGQLLIPSTPWLEQGLLFTLYSENRDDPKIAMAVHAKTTTMRPDEHTASFVERERIRDADNARREFDAEAMSAGTSAFFDIEEVRATLDPSMPLILQPQGFQRAWCGLDTGFRRDPSGAAIVRESRGRLELAELIEIRPKKGERLKPSEVIKHIIDRARFHGCEAIIADGHYIETVREYVGTVPLLDAPADKSVPYIETRTEIKEGRLHIPKEQTQLVAQLKDVVSKPTPGGGLQISSPRKGGTHGDRVSALTLAVWGAVQAVGSAPVVDRGRPGITDSLTSDKSGRRQRLFG